MIDKKIDTKNELMAGAFAGAVARLLTAPFDVLKIRYQLQSSVDRKVLHPKALIAHLLHIVAVQLPVIFPSPPIPSSPLSLRSSDTACILRASLEQYTGVWNALVTIVKDEGLFSLWKGNISATYLWVSYSMIQFSCYAALKALSESLTSASSTTPSSSSDIHSKRRTPNGQNALWKAITLFCAGAGAGMIATASTYPFDIIRTQFALQGKERTYLTINSFVTKTISNHGFIGLYTGLPAALVGIMPYMGLNFALYESVQRFSPIRAPSSSANATKDEFTKVAYNGACGAVAGGLSKFMVFPLDTIKKKMQGKVILNYFDKSPLRFDTVGQCLQHTLKNEGIRGLYRGIIPTTLKSVAATAVTFAAYEGAKEFLGQASIEE